MCGSVYGLPCVYLKEGNRLCLYSDPLHLVKSDLIARAVIKFGGARRFVCRDGLSILDRAAIFQISGAACCAECVATGGVGETRA
jgi:hypothetical protein